jgi:hypothetical protein
MGDDRRIERLKTMPLSAALDLEEDICGPGKYRNAEFHAWALAAEALEVRIGVLREALYDLYAAQGGPADLLEAAMANARAVLSKVNTDAQ